MIEFVFSVSGCLYQDIELMLQWRSVTGVITVEFVFSGSERLYQDIELMTGNRPSILWKVCWCVISPLIILVITITTGY